MKVDKSNHDVYLFNSDQPFHHYASGQLVLAREEASKLFELGDAYELLICAGGQCRVSWGQQRQVLKRGSCLLVAPHTRLELAGGESPVTCYWIQFFPKDSEERVAYQHVADAIRDRYDLGRLANNVILPQYYQIREFNRINTMCLQTLLLIRGNYYTEALPSYAITELMLEITNDFITGLHHLTRANPKATEIIDWLSSHLDADLTVRGLADHFEMNYRYVSRLIKKETGMTASRLILQKKLDIACGLLLKSNLPLKLIADQAYFNDEKYFLRCFKKQLGQTPTQYRQQYMDDFLLNDTRTREARR